MQIMRLSSFFTLLTVLLFQLHVIHSFTNLADVDCGLSSIKGRKAKIVNGDETFEGEFPWMVSLVGLRGELICGGVLIHKKWVLTAAHCIRKEATQFQVSVAWNRGENNIPNEARMFRINRIVNHPSYDPVKSKVADDIALINLAQEAAWSDLVKPICLPDPVKESLTGVMATVAGWGHDKSGGRHATKLRKVGVPILANEKCKQWLVEGRKDLAITENSMCAGYEEGGKDSCNGDSGGPLMIQEKSHHVAIGLVSGGIGCALPKLPGIYTRIDNYLEWISQTLDGK
ncbi:hypothetical protein GHT06_013696 [Daphnia sinensis]|uniref:Peptidase S1 domain-containing protein n=1 Tax=Daphnia sinensis TaxID=1820382 RepID=A0AAD5LBK8_9CRUS|nr:hypothetical protein GHT06_013696 [Daphnia sinensis]